MPSALPGTSGFGAPPGFAPAAPSYPPQMSAQSLVNPQAMPEWMREAGAMSPPAPATGGMDGSSWGQPNGAFQSRSLPPHPFGAGAPRPQPSMPEPGSFAANQLFDASALPEWLRQAGAGQPFDTLATAHQPTPGARMAPPASPAGGAFAPAAFPSTRQAYPPAGGGGAAPAASAFPSIDQAGAYGAGPAQQGNLSAQSLFDPAALPAWLGGNGAGATSGLGAQQHGGRIPAQSLLDESSLPQWMRNQPAAPATPAAPMFSGPGSQAAPGGWGIAPSPPVGPLPAPATSATSWGPASAAPGSSQLSAGNFVDEGALPDWLRSQGQAAGFIPPASAPLAAGLPAEDRRPPMYVPPSVPSEQAHGPAAATGATFAASDLIDADSLPQWVRGRDGGGGASFSSTEGWTSKGPSVPLAPGSGSIGGVPSGYTDHQPVSQVMPVDERPDTEDASWFSGRHATSMDASIVEHADAGRGTGNFGRGAPIPHEELPSWLRTNAPGGRAARGAAARHAPAWDEPAASPYGDEREQYGVDVGYDADAGYDAAPAWNGGYDQLYDQPYDQQFEGGYEGGYGAVDEYGQPMSDGWDEGYGDYDDYDGAREPRRGFWGRLFGRG